MLNLGVLLLPGVVSEKRRVGMCKGRQAGRQADSAPETAGPLSAPGRPRYRHRSMKAGEMAGTRRAHLSPGPVTVPMP